MATFDEEFEKIKNTIEEISESISKFAELYPKYLKNKQTYERAMSKYNNIIDEDIPNIEHKIHSQLFFLRNDGEYIKSISSETRKNHIGPIIKICRNNKKTLETLKEEIEQTYNQLTLNEKTNLINNNLNKIDIAPTININNFLIDFEKIKTLFKETKRKVDAITKFNNNKTILSITSNKTILDLLNKTMTEYISKCADNTVTAKEWDEQVKKFWGNIEKIEPSMTMWVTGLNRYVKQGEKKWKWNNQKKVIE